MKVGESLSKLIDKAIEENYIEERREYIGASMIGNPCLRAIWYSLKGCDKKSFSAKTIRTFNTGHVIEKMIKKELLTIKKSLLASGIIVAEDVSLTGNDEEDVPMFQGTVDCIIQINGKNYILEIKSANDKSFKDFVKKGLQDWRPEYYSQVQAYMGMLKIDGAYVLVVNKNTGEIHDEYVVFNEIFYHELKYKAKEIAESEVVPKRLNEDPTYYICAMCQYKETCHQE